jgi:exopolysaccharide biosynthesis polyprenyl glycosylphosphotransferase
VTSLTEIIKAVNPQEVLISVEKPNHTLLLRILSICTKYKIIVKIVPDLYDMFTGQVRTLPIYGIPLIEISSTLLTPLQAVIKRIMDIVISLFVLIVGLPLWLLIAFIIKLESKGPVFYKQPRIGKDGQQFMIYKFRSMVKDADKEGQRWTSINDPRVTKFGKIIRKTHLDEIPQFINVLKGEMSIVGPRPEQPLIVEKYSKIIPYYRRRLLVRPGITGWWQVHYKSHVESKEEIVSRLKDDFYYIENISLRLDIEIMIRTIYCVLTGHGQT